MPRFSDIPQFTPTGSYVINVCWATIESNLATFAQGVVLDLDPDFQRAHVWTEEQQIRYVEFALRGGRTGREILFNCRSWQRLRGKNRDTMVLVDGKQRLEAVRRFLANEFPAFGVFYRDFEDELSMTGPQFLFVVNDLATRAQVLQWYIDLNSGGTVHTDAEIEKVRRLLAAEGV